MDHAFQQKTPTCDKRTDTQANTAIAYTVQAQRCTGNNWNYDILYNADTKYTPHTYKSSAICHLNLQAFIQPRLQLFTAKWLFCRWILK